MMTPEPKLLRRSHTSVATLGQLGWEKARSTGRDLTACYAMRHPNAMLRHA